MIRSGPFDPREDAHLLSAYLDGELDAADDAWVAKVLQESPEARRIFAELKQVKDLAGAMRLKEAPPEAWEGFRDSIYNRGERSLGWLLLITGAALVAGWGALQLVAAIWNEPDLPGPVRFGILGVVAGLALLLLSVVRERIHTRRRTRYKDVIR
ncbi:MAG: anti-sigma factor [Candidatus Krumholzibacteriia bacterium]